jgi:hypothetical protein
MKGKTMLNKKASALAAVACITTVGLALGISPAKAIDPVAQKFAIVGSDTLEDVVGALVNGSDITGTGITITTSDSSTMGSFDATGTGTIITKQYGTRFQRPNGSGDGRTALTALINGTAYTSSYSSRDKTYDATTLKSGSIDIVRASSGGTQAGDSTDIMQRFSFGRDAIALAYGSAVTFPVATGYIPAAALKLLYQCDSTTLTAYNVSKVWIPQAGSGTRTDFLSKAGLSDTQDILANLDGESNYVVNTPSGTTAATAPALGGGCVHVGQEHDASTLGTRDITPMSASRWIAMKNGGSYNKAGTATLGGFVSVSGTPTTYPSPVSGSGSNLRPAVAYYKDSTWGRDTYLFVDRRRVDNSGAKTITSAGSVSATVSLSATAQAPSRTTTVASAVSGATVLTTADALTVYPGTTVTGTGIASGTTVKSFSGTTLTLSTATTAALSATTLTFGSNVVKMDSSTAGLTLSQEVTGTGIASSTTVSAISGDYVTLSKDVTAAITSGSLTFGNVAFVTGSLSGVFANLGATGTGIASGSTIKAGLVADTTKTITGTAVTFPTAQKVLLGINAGSQVGQFLTGTGIAAGTQVTAVSATSTVATNKTASAASAADTTITLDGVSGVAVGQQVQYLGVKANTYVTAISGNVVTVSNALVTGIASGKAITFADVSRNTTALSDATTSFDVEGVRSNLTLGSAVTGTNVADDVVVTAISGSTVTVNKAIMKTGKTSSALANTLTFVKNEATLSQPLTASITTAGTEVTAANTVRLSKAITADLTSSSTVTTSNTFYNAILAKLFDYTYDGSLVWQGSVAYASVTDSTTWPASDPMALKLKYGFLPASTQPTNEYAK